MNGTLPQNDTTPQTKEKEALLIKISFGITILFLLLIILYWGIFCAAKGEFLELVCCLEEPDRRPTPPAARTYWDSIVRLSNPALGIPFVREPERVVHRWHVE